MKSDSVLKQLTIKGKRIKAPIIQGGMGVGVSLHPLAQAVAREGGLGIVSSACIDRLVSKRSGKKVNTYEAVYEEISLSKIKGGFTGINIMAPLPGISMIQSRGLSMPARTRSSPAPACRSTCRPFSRPKTQHSSRSYPPHAHSKSSAKNGRNWDTGPMRLYLRDRLPAATWDSA